MNLKTVNDFEAIMKMHLTGLRNVCKKLFTQESLNDYMSYKSLLNTYNEDEPKLCYCDHQDFNQLVYILDKYMITTQDNIEELEIFVKKLEYHSC